MKLYKKCPLPVKHTLVSLMFTLIVIGSFIAYLSEKLAEEKVGAYDITICTMRTEIKAATAAVA